mgnify:CR=1 FL=1
MTKRIGLALALSVGVAGSASAQATISASASVAQVAQETGVERDVVFAEGTPGGAGGSAVTAAATGANATGPQLGFVEYELNYSGPSVTVAAPATLSPFCQWKPASSNAPTSRNPICTTAAMRARR